MDATVARGLLDRLRSARQQAVCSNKSATHVAGAPVCMLGGDEDWAEHFRAAFPHIERRPAVRWRYGGWHHGHDAEGALVVEALGGEVQCRGGAQGWLQREDLDAEGWAEGWELEYARLRDTLHYDDQCQPVDASGRAVDVTALPPALQLHARSALRMAQEARDAGKPLRSVLDGKGQKRKGHGIDKKLLLLGRDEAALWQARLQLTAAVSLDGAWDDVEIVVGGRKHKERRTAFAVCWHDGTVDSGQLDETLGEDNYLAELAAQVRCFQRAERGDRVMVTFDATSPVVAERRFRRVSDRARQDYYAAAWLDELRRGMAKVEVALMTWQTSHVWEVRNEWADLEAGAALQGRVVRVRCERPSFAAVTDARVRGKRRTHAIRWARREVDRRLADALEHTALPHEDDVQLYKLPDREERALWGLRAQRCVFHDERRFWGEAARAERSRHRCACGADRCDWQHVMYECQAEEMPEAREALVECILRVRDMLEGVPHTQSIALLARLRGRANARGTERADVGAHRMVSGLTSGASTEAPGSAACRRAVTEMASAAARLALTGRLLNAEAEGKIKEVARACGKLRAGMQVLLWKARRAGPARSAAIQEVVHARRLVTSVIIRRYLASPRTKADVVRREQLRLRLRQLTRTRMEAVRAQFPPAGWAARRLWNCARWYTLWRCLGAWRGGRQVEGHVECEFATALARATLEEDSIVVKTLRDTPEGTRGGPLKPPIMGTWKRQQRAKALALTYDKAAWREEERVEREKRRWLERKQKREKARQYAMAAMRRCCRPGGHGTVSGAPAPRYASKITVTIDARARHRTLREGSKAWLKRQQVRQFGQGRRPINPNADPKKQRWAVDKILDVSRRKGQGRAISVLIQWMGAEAMCYEDTWEPWSAIPPDLRAEVRQIRPDLFPTRQKRAQPPPAIGSRRSGRLQGAAAGGPPADSEPRGGFNVAAIMDKARAVRARRQRRDAEQAAARSEQVARARGAASSGAQPRELQALLDERQQRAEGKKRMRADVAQRLEGEYNVGIVLNPELAKIRRRVTSGPSYESATSDEDDE